MMTSWLLLGTLPKFILLLRFPANKYTIYIMCIVLRWNHVGILRLHTLRDKSAHVSHYTPDLFLARAI